jgi:serine/threonine protein kinase
MHDAENNKVVGNRQSALWLQAKEIVGDLLEAPVEERRAILDARCGEDSALRREVEAYLAAASDTGAFLAQPAGQWSQLEQSFASHQRDHSGELMGAWRLKREIGRGGMSVVYLAERADGAYQQDVALKVMLTSHTEDAGRRMARERQALAELNHPNIARLLDGGISATGVPFLVMEHVDGARIDDWCDKHNADVTARVKLVVAICDAVQHAHQNLIIHRDIKPANILINTAGIPKLLDFGVARLMEASGQDISDTATASQLLFTPRYASPEQVRGLPVNVATDVYGLGLLLYELLAGNSPFERISSQTATSAVAAMQAILEDRYRNASEVAATHAPRRAAQLTGELDLILAKACSRESSERYATTGLLADDLRRWIEKEPILARPQSWHYVAGKFMVRNKLVSFISAALAVSLVGGTTLVAIKSQQEADARQRAEKRFDDVRKLANKVLFEYYDEAASLNNSLKLREMLAADSVGYLDTLSKDAGNNTALIQEVATGYERLGSIFGRTFEANKGRPEIARQHLQKALALRENAYQLAPDNLDHAVALASTLREVTDLELGQGDANTGAKLADRAVSILKPHIEKKGAGASLNASQNYWLLVRMRASFNSCSGPNSRGNSAEGWQLLKTNMSFFDAYAQARLAAGHTANTVQGDRAGLLIEYGAAASCLGEFAIADKALNEAVSLFSEIGRKTGNTETYSLYAGMAEIEVATNEWQSGQYDKSVATSLRAYARVAPLVKNATDDIGLQLRWLVILSKTAAHHIAANQDIPKAIQLLDEGWRVADNILRTNPSNQFARTLSIGIKNQRNIAARLQGEPMAARIAAQKDLIAERESTIKTGSLNALLLQARLYAELARMYPTEAHTEACAALSESFALLENGLVRDGENVRFSLVAINNAIDAKQIEARTGKPCITPKYAAVAITQLNALKARKVAHRQLPMFEAQLMQ